MADNITITDGNAAAQVVRSTDNGGVHTPHHIVDEISLPSAVVFGRKTVASAGSDEALGASTPLDSGVTVKALASNTGVVYLGSVGVSAAAGFELAAGESQFVEIDDLIKIRLDVSVGGEGVTYIGS